MSRSRRHCLVASVAICVLSASSAQAQTPAPERTVAAQGVASVKVIAPKDRAHEGPIRAAVEAAEAKALPRAIAGARENATATSRSSRRVASLLSAISFAMPASAPAMRALRRPLSSKSCVSATSTSVKSLGVENLGPASVSMTGFC